MAVIHDMMPAYELFQPTDVEGAIALLNEHGDGARVLGGGMDTWDWLKDRTKRVTALVDLSAIESLREIRTTDDGIEIGAMAPLSTIAKNPDIRERFSVLAEGAGLVASPQIRNQGTIGGNVNQDTRCWYYRSGWPCYRAGGNICYANTPASLNREHAILGADRCVAVSPSDSAPALIALDARVRVIRQHAHQVGRVVRHRRLPRHGDRLGLRDDQDSAAQHEVDAKRRAMPLRFIGTDFLLDHR